MTSVLKHKQRNKCTVLECPKTTISSQILSRENRLGLLLEEGLERYRSNAVPYWSTLYGTHLADEGHSNSLEEIIRMSEWTSITGDLWKIPHDNRVTFCFLAPLSDPTILIQVRNFLLHFHKIEGSTMERDSCLHIWDCFDSGLSVHWFPGRRMPNYSPVVNDMRMEGVRETCGNPTTLSRLVAPWRRIMYVCLYCH